MQLGGVVLCGECFDGICHPSQGIGLVVAKEHVDRQQVAVLVEQLPWRAGDDGVEQALVPWNFIPAQTTFVHAGSGLFAQGSQGAGGHHARQLLQPRLQRIDSHQGVVVGAVERRSLDHDHVLVATGRVVADHKTVVPVIA
ncbi:hypothetical protein D3C73_934650 [compost metagenome]